MSAANERQYGGSHYKKLSYEHWDFVCDVGLHYVPACASKYVSRWKDKGGVLDLQKALHYIDKSEERGIGEAAYLRGNGTALKRFVEQLEPTEAKAITAMAMGDWFSARRCIQCLIDQEEMGNECLPA